MILSPFSGIGKGKFYLSGLLLTLTLSGANIPVIAETSTLPTPIAQNSQVAQNQDLMQRAEKVLELWADEQFKEVRPYLTPNLQVLLPVSEMQRIWDEYVADVGRIKTIGQGREVDAINATLVIIPVEFEKLKGKVIITFNDKKEVVGVNFPTLASIEIIAENAILAISKGDLIKARDNFHPDLKTEISPQELQKRWEQLQRRTGNFKRLIFSEEKLGSHAGDVNLVFVTVEFEKTTEPFIFIFDQDKNIIGVDFPINNQ
jgi:hypothetical protein